MTDPKKYWLRDAEGASALVIGIDERNRLASQGWAEADEPTDGFVYVWREGIEQPGRAPVALFDQVLSQAGWVAGPPPGGEHPLELVAAAPTVKPTMTTTAAGGSTKEK